MWIHTTGRIGISEGSGDDIRESMRRALPAWLQPVLTYITGKPYQGEVPRTRTPMFHVVMAVASLGEGVGLSLGAYLLGIDALAPLGWVPTIAGARKLQVTIVHQCSHDNLFGREWLDACIGTITSILLTIQNFPAYNRMHIATHHSKRLMTPGEATADFLTSMLGLRLGAPKAALWRQLRRALMSPLFHARFLAKRLWGQVAGAPLGYALGASGFLAAVVVGVTVTQTWWPFLLVWGIPMTVGYQIAAVLRLCVEHLWPTQGAQHSRAGVASLTQAVFLGKRVPEAALPRMGNAWAWTRWTAHMLGCVLVRYVVLPGDTVVHDYHHRHASSKAWPYAVFARQQDIEAGHPGWPPYTEVWGLRRAVDAVLESLSQAHVPTV